MAANNYLFNKNIIWLWVLFFHYLPCIVFLFLSHSLENWIVKTQFFLYLIFYISQRPRTVRCTEYYKSCWCQFGHWTILIELLVFLGNYVLLLFVSWTEHSNLLSKMSVDLVSFNIRYEKSLHVLKIQPPKEVSELVQQLVKFCYVKCYVSDLYYRRYFLNYYTTQDGLTTIYCAYLCWEIYNLSVNMCCLSCWHQCPSRPMTISLTYPTYT